MSPSHIEILRQEINNLCERIANIPRRMESIISSANEAARTSERFLVACRDSVNSARSLNSETVAHLARLRESTTDHSPGWFGVGLVVCAAVLTGGIALLLLAALAAAIDLLSSLAVVRVSSSFGEQIGNLDDHQRNMGEKVRELEREWLNRIHTCVTMMERDTTVKHKLFNKERKVIVPSLASIQSDFDNIFENLDLLQSVQL
uniref:Uncharacterized protein n=1 Tax=Branchiostoma floridae TaxID=7739 RepID=C3ZMF6_BRAFL|eukprot:XP_002590401.1 hypothetical protein BRAFLDRAFT_121418 [Branchiostoma floridae]